MDHARRFRIALACTLVPLLLAACGDGGADPDAQAAKQAALGAVVNPNDVQLRRMAVDPATAALARWSAPGTLPLTPVSMANLPDGRLLINGGIDAGHTSLFDPGTGAWRRLPGVPVTPFLQAGTLWGSDSHMWLIPAGNGRVLQAGPQAAMAWIDPQGNGAIQPVGPRGDDADAVTGITVMYDTGRILKAGGMTGIGGDNSASRASYVIDVNGGVAVRKVGAMNYARTFHNSVVLPNGQVVIVGGQTRGVGFSNDFAVLPAEIFDPISETFATLPAMTRPRNDHSIAVLLPDGRVMSAGGGLCDAGRVANQPNYEILSPPYLFDSDGSEAVRPRIASAPATVGHGARVRVNADANVVAFAMVRLSSTTHTVNNDQRRVPVSFTSPSPGVYDLDIPSNPGILLAGQALFRCFGCVDCHGGADFTASATLGLVEVGTIRQPTSGRHLGAPLAGIDPPTLRDAWATAPYLHDGSAPTLPAAIRAHRGLVATDLEVAQLARHVAEIGDGAPPPTETPGPVGQYWSGTVPGSGTLLATRSEAVDFNWGTGAPAGVAADRFAARWTGPVIADVGGLYRFQTVSDDGVRLWVTGQLLVDRWNDHAPTIDDTVALNLAAGQRYDVRLEYYERGGAVMRLHWLRPGQTLWEPTPVYVLRPPGATP